MIKQEKTSGPTASNKKAALIFGVDVKERGPLIMFWLKVTNGHCDLR